MPRGPPRARGARRLTRANRTLPRRRLELIPAGGVSLDLLRALGAGIDARLGTEHCVTAPLAPFAAAGADAEEAERRSGAFLDAVIARADAEGVDPRRVWLLGVSAAALHAPGHGRVFGEAAVGAGCAVVGLAPLDGAGTSAATVLLDRAVKVCVHELGHAAGLEHCADRGCVMHPSRDIAGVDRKDNRFCRRCANDLTHATLDAARG